ncbi:MAG TPA: N-acyl homoserine lactonase family protein [Lautropia sp.]|nr:N-acyl homoserine lactonase family protein [Lautropia sp.]
MSWTKTLLAAAAAVTLTGMQAAPNARPGLSMWRLDCGTIQVSDLDVFSDSFAYVGQRKTLTNSCYLIRNGDRLLLWDTGLPADARGSGSGAVSMTTNRRVVDQLAQIGVGPEQVNFVGISHNHGDHIGQAADFPRATLLMGAEDFEATKAGANAARIAPWASGSAKVEPIRRDHDVFGDGSVTILDMPGHTPGHQALLVRLRSGPVLLSGDQYHFTENRRAGGVPSFNADRSDTLGSHDRFEEIARNLKAKVIIQHETADVAKLPAFPKAAQ